MQASTIANLNPSWFHRLLADGHKTGAHKGLAEAAAQFPVPSRDTFESPAADTVTFLLYQAYSERTRISAQYQEAAVRAAGEDGEDASEIAARQLNFEFLREVRAEQIAIFHQRTAQAADQLEGAQQTNYLETSQRVAARFSASVNVSVSVLQGFAGASEAAGSDGGDLIDRLIEFTNQVLTQVDDILNEAFILLDGLGGGENGFDFGARIQETLAQLESFFRDFFGAQNPGGDGVEGSTQQISAFGLQLEFEFSFDLEVSVEGIVQQSDPISLDLDGDGIELSGYTNGARFDILGRGSAVNTAFVTGGDAFLALDRNANGRIDSGLELFGDQRGAVNGFEELRKLDSNKDGVIDGQDADFSHLLLFRDNGNGITEDGELISLADAGIAAIQLGYRNVREVASGGNRIAQVAAYRRTDGSYGRVVDAVLNYTV